jgi:serine protease Do
MVLGGMSVEACRNAPQDTSTIVVGLADAARPAVVRVFGRGGLAQPSGSGFYIRGRHGKSLVVTNHHVIWGADDILIERNDGTTDTASIVGTDPSSDLALLSPRSNSASNSLSFGDDGSLHQGEWLVCIGSPIGLLNAMSVGILSARARVYGATLAAQKNVDHLFTEAALGPGSSGSPLLDMHGRVVGINVSITGSIRGLGVAIPSSLALGIIQDLELSGQSLHSTAGIDVIDRTDTKSQKSAFWVKSVTPGGPADLAQFRVGDQIVAVDGKRLLNVSDFQIRVFLAAPGSTLRVDIVRDGKPLSSTIHVQLVSAPDSTP